MEVSLGFNASSLIEFVKNKDGSELATFNGPSTCRVSFCRSAICYINVICYMLLYAANGCSMLYFINLMLYAADGCSMLKMGPHGCKN